VAAATTPLPAQAMSPAAAGAAVIAALHLSPGWAGFALLAIALVALAGLVLLAIPHTRVGPQSPVDTREREQRLLVIADPHCSGTAVRDEVLRRLADAVAVHLVVPIRVSHLHFLADDESHEHDEAERSLRASVALLEQRGVAVTGSVGADKPLDAMTDALAFFAATRVLLVTPPERESYWAERDLLARARRLTTIPVEQVLVGADLERRSSTGAAQA
jgi:hypothetical protein